MKTIILSALVALFTLLSCGDAKVSQEQLGTGQGTAYIKVFQDRDAIKEFARNFDEIKDLLPPAETGKTYKATKLDEAFKAIDQTLVTPFLKALSALKMIKSAKNNTGANIAEIDKEFDDLMVHLGFVKGDENTDKTYAKTLKTFRTKLSE
ncbi:hypothetical protein [Borrelia persica]|uniref:hypothetical protein n=1 Tax=Borrelia persica TaxID=44448 RepID=UPI0004B07ED0|nr:hypothetical protein [Borrelia persica]